MGKIPNKDALRQRAEEKVEMMLRKNLAQHLLDLKGKEVLHELQVHMVELTMQNEELKEAQNALEDAKNRYEALYNSAPACYLTVERDGLICEANLTASSLLNIPRDRLIGSFFQSLLTPESADLFHLFLRRDLHPGEIEVLKLRLHSQEGSPVEMSLSVNAEVDRSSRLVRYRLIFVDPRCFHQKHE